jgi:hypothetical protein
VKIDLSVAVPDGVNEHQRRSTGRTTVDGRVVEIDRDVLSGEIDGPNGGVVGRADDDVS